jgi:hypothetical protein
MNLHVFIDNAFSDCSTLKSLDIEADLTTTPTMFNENIIILPLGHRRRSKIALRNIQHATIHRDHIKSRTDSKTCNRRNGTAKSSQRELDSDVC